MATLVISVLWWTKCELQTNGEVHEMPMTENTSATPKCGSIRTTPASRRKFKTSFKSPLQRDSSKSGELKNEEELKKEIEEMKKQEEEQDKEITELEQLGFSEEELSVYIEKLHEYNEMKDIGQMLLGRIAMQRGVTVRSLYEEYGLGLED